MPKLSITPIDPSQETGPMGYCPYMNIKFNNESYKTLTDGLVSPEKRYLNENTALPPSLPNGGLYGGPQSTESWANIPVIPSDTNLIHYNLRSANPPPGATEQYISNDRLGNNSTHMIGVYWYNDKKLDNMHRLAVTKKIDVKQY